MTTKLELDGIRPVFLTDPDTQQLCVNLEHLMGGQVVRTLHLYRAVDSPANQRSAAAMTALLTTCCFLRSFGVPQRTLEGWLRELRKVSDLDVTPPGSKLLGLIQRASYEVLLQQGELCSWVVRESDEALGTVETVPVEQAGQFFDSAVPDIF